MNISRSNTSAGVYPLSSAQSRIWFMENLNEDTRAYNDPYDYQVTGNLNPALLEDSIRVLMDRHEALRTVFRNDNGVPAQIILPHMVFKIDIVSLLDEDPALISQTISQYSLASSQRKFDLENGPLFYVGLLKITETQHILLINFHHIISDAVSIRIFLDELFEIYHGIINKKPANLPDIPINYRDYSVWENEWLNSAECRSQVDYWKTELEGIPDMLQLPLDFPRPRVQRFTGEEYFFRIDETTRSGLSALSKRHGTSLLIPMLSAYAILLSKYSLQNDLVIGVPVANRAHEELQGLMGVLINTLPLRFNIKDDTTLGELLENARTRFMMGYENKSVPFEKLVDEMKTRRSLNSSPVYQVLFNYLTAFESEIRYPDVVLQQLPGERRAALEDLTLTILDQKTWANCIIQYDTDLFRKETIERMAGHYLTILRTIISQDNLRIGEIPLLTEEEKEKMLIEWNKTKKDYPSFNCIHHLFEEQAEETPSALAVEDDNTSLTYSELNERSNRLAAWLAGKGATEDTCVALLTERNIDMVVGLMAIVKTGAALLPLDPLYPKHRLELIVNDAKPVLFLSHRSLEDHIPANTTEIIYMDDHEDWKDQLSVNLHKGNPQKPAYILFTSGSTGKPKGVRINHNSLVNLVSYFKNELNVTEKDVLFSVTTIAFDIAELDMYLPLCSGGKLVIASREATLDMSLLIKKIQETGATIFQATPVTYKMLVLNNWNGKAGLKVISGGEALSKELAKNLRERCEEVWNCYGPTETTIYSTARKLTKEDTEGEGFAPIGIPMDNTIVYVLNPDGVPQPIGIPGELYIGGDGVSPGYVNLPEITSQRFVPDHISRKPKTNLYKTGDIVKYQPDGQLAFLNRIDSQVKIRGFRIELGEVESSIQQFPGIKENVVAVKDDPSGEKMLVAYYIPQGGIEIDRIELRQFLKDRLPDYMVPSAFVMMDQFPLTVNNKINRNVLPEPDVNMKSTVMSYVKPETPTEMKLAKIWESLLKTDKISATEDFFEAGGHSMIAVTLIIRIEKEFGIRVPLASLFERSTIRGMAQLIDDGTQKLEARFRSLVPIRTEGSMKPIFLVHGLGLNVLLYTTLIKHLDPEQPVYGLQAKGLNGVDPPLETIEEIAAHYISEVETVDSEGPYIIAGFSLGGKIAFEMARQLTAKRKEVVFLGMFDSVAENKNEIKSLNHLFNYFTWNVRSLFGDDENGENKKQLMKRKMKGLERKITGQDIEVRKESMGDESELPDYVKHVHKANKKADRNYVLKPYTGNLHLFKAKNQTFYIKDTLTYGWDKYARGGVIIHEIPGEHSSIFAPPNDKYFADILQRHIMAVNETNQRSV